MKPTATPQHELTTNTPAADHFFRQTAERTADGLCFLQIVHNEVGQLVDLGLQYLNPAARKWLDYAGPVANVSAFEVLARSELTSLKATCKEVAESGQLMEQEIAIYDGQTWLHIQLIPFSTGVTLVIRDVTHYHNSQQELSQLKEELAAQLTEARRLQNQSEQITRRTERLQNVTAALSEALTPSQVAQVVIQQGFEALEADSGSVVLLDQTRTQLTVLATTGFTAEVVQIWQAFPLNSPVPIARAVREANLVLIEDASDPTIKQSQPVLYEFARQNKDRTLLCLPLVVDSQVMGALGLTFKQVRQFDQAELEFIKDLTRQCAQALERARLYQAAQEKVQLQTELDYVKDLFMSTATHELRNPLASLRGYLQIVQRNLERAQEGELGQEELARLANKNRRAVDGAVQQTEMMERLIDELLDFARLQNHKLELDYSKPGNLVELVQRVVEQYDLKETEHPVIMRAREELIQVVIDETRVEQVLHNLITNAIKYSPTKTLVTVGLKSAVNPQTQRPEAIVWVQDEGYGIPPEQQARIFDRYYRVRNQATHKIEGLGLGLYISHSLVENLGGRMWLESQPGLGSTFYFALPLEPS